MIAQTTVQPTVGRIDLEWKPMQVGKFSAIVPVSQAEAERILEDAPYPNQRKVDEPTIVILQRYLTTGRFRISTIHLMYCLATERWYLVNGQHRMWALRRAGVTTDFDVISEVVETFADVEAAYTSHDRGRTRSATQLINALASVGDDLNRTQMSKAHTAAGVLLKGFGPERKATRHLDTFDRRLKLAFALSDEALGYFTAIQNKPKLLVMKALDSSLLTAFGIATFWARPERAGDFWAAVVDLSDDDAGDDAPERAVTAQVLQRDLQPFLMAKQLAACWNAAMEKRPVPRMSNRLMTAPISIFGTPFEGNVPMRFTMIGDEVKVVPFDFEGDD